MNIMQTNPEMREKASPKIWKSAQNALIVMLFPCLKPIAWATGCLAFIGFLIFPINQAMAMASESIFYPPNEEFTYDIRFLGFIKAGESRIQIRRIYGNQYKARMMAETKGFVGFFSRYRKNSYTTEMEYIPKQRRFVTHRFSKVVTWGDEIRKSVSESDYRKKIHRWAVTKNGILKSKGSEKIPDGITYEDMISAFYNLRYGALGPLTPGRRIHVVSQPFSQVSMLKSEKELEVYQRKFEIRIANSSIEQNFRERFDRTNEKGILVLVNVPNDFFGQNKGDVIIWFNNKLMPVITTVEDVFLFGDVTGTLVNFRIQHISALQHVGSN